MDSDFQLGEFLPYRINRLAERVSASLARVYVARFQITVPQWRIMATLNESPGLSATAITRRCHLDKVKVSRAVADLEKRGLLTRCPHAGDGRANELRLTPPGEALFAQIAPLALDWQGAMLAGMSAAERRTLEQVLCRLEERVDSVVADAAVSGAE